MSGFSNIEPDPSMIGRLRPAPFALIPDPPVLFRRRAERLAGLAPGHDLALYLRFLERVCATQAELAATLPPPAPIPPEQVERARAGTMPPLDRDALAAAPELRDTVARFLAALSPEGMPAPAAAALAMLREAPEAVLTEMLGNVLADAIPFDALPPHLFLSAAVQLHAARLAAPLDPERLVPVGTGLCPVCGGPPVASVVVGFQGAEGARYAACACCGTQWNVVRITCLACGSTKGIGYKAPEADGTAPNTLDADATVKAETCDTCRSWVKILYQNRNAALEPVADDVASLGLDLLMQGTEYRRAGFDPFLIGY
ncbi:formate dehydrogenase accessory protein FdhE [Roseomonas sp. NAR14]|uniref:Protein FdhE homolog n=1 Tax=Roseomonas acroporae TaxID=2937791 RepID=A0A9X1YAE9_9PROT|nr:formate dehydrogenase accessory protein FdhE [Roseomonas acroporae]MCK8787114.1 formate dehydrogenase accessory protein FdhE [Roseomonas acroporae]